MGHMDGMLEQRRVPLTSQFQSCLFIIASLATAPAKHVHVALFIFDFFVIIDLGLGLHLLTLTNAVTV